MDSDSVRATAVATGVKKPATSPTSARPKLPYFDSLSWFQCYFCQRWRIADFEQASAKASKWTCLDTFWSDESQMWSSSCQFQEDKPVSCVNPNSGARNQVDMIMYAASRLPTSSVATAPIAAVGNTKPLTTSDLMQQSTQAERKRQSLLAKKVVESSQSGTAMGGQFDSDAKRSRISDPSSTTLAVGGSSPSSNAIKSNFLSQQQPLQFLTPQQTQQLLQHQSFRPQQPQAFNRLQHHPHALHQQQQFLPTSRRFDRQWFVQFMDRLAMRLSVDPSPVAPQSFTLLLRSYTDTIINEHTPPHVMHDTLQEILKWIHHLPTFEQDLREFMQTRL
ncbi:hypothetical protein BASA81_008091 [Batrachochytrium salamandrivorans]|nr:hypothetical protein BASA81_008091 [Batrachochytrium salamandrivorans]